MAEMMRNFRGFGLMDLMITLAITAVLVTLAVPAYDMFVTRAKVSKAIGDMGVISIAVEQFRLRNNDRIPMSLNELSVPIPLDPWQRPYEFLNIPAAPSGSSALRKDGKLNPINTDFDLYSRGADGDTAGPLSAKASRDDIVRANNGAFFGLGKDY